MAKPLKRTARREQAIIDRLAQGWSVGQACRVAGITRQTLHNWRTADPAFAERVAEAEDLGTDLIEDVVTEMAVRGNLKAALAMLRARRSNKWGTITRQEISGAGGGALRIEVVYADDHVGAGSRP